MPPVTIRNAMHLARRLHLAGQLQQAEAVYRQVLQQVPNHPEALHLMGVVAHQTGRHRAAIDWIRQAIFFNPLVGDYSNNLGLAYQAAGMLEDAIACYQRAITLRADCPEWHANLGNALREKGQLDEAISAYLKALQLKDDIPGIHNNLGCAWRQKDKMDEAIAAFRKAIGIQHDFVDAYLNLGNALRQKGQMDDAIAALRRATEIQPDFAEAYNSLGAALSDVGRLDEAIVALRKAIQIRGDFAEAHNNLGAVLQGKGFIDEAIAAFERAIQLNPQFAEAHRNKSLMFLLMGDYDHGWAEYDWRWKCKGWEPRTGFSQPQWNGTDPSGMRMLIHPEGDFGDAIQFVRYAPLVARRGGRVIVVCQPDLKALFESLEGVHSVMADGEPFPAFEMHIPMMSLPRIFGTTTENIPAEVPYLKPDPARVAEWRERVGRDREKLRVGIVWASTPWNQECRKRTVPPDKLAALGMVKGVMFYSLQKGKATEEAKNQPAGIELIDLTNDIKDFADTAALIAHLDLVISVDTAVAHLAGAMAKPVWLMLPFAPSWQWMLDREDNPWYPTMRLFRQRVMGDWNSVAKRVAEELAKFQKHEENK